MCSDNGPEFIPAELQRASRGSGIQKARIEPGKPWQNGSNECFNGTFRRECLNAELFCSLMEAQMLKEQWHEA